MGFTYLQNLTLFFIVNKGKFYFLKALSYSCEMWSIKKLCRDNVIKQKRTCNNHYKDIRIFLSELQK